MLLYIQHEYQTNDEPDKGKPKERIIPLSAIREVRPAGPDEGGPNVQSAIITDRTTYYVRESVAEIAERTGALDISKPALTLDLKRPAWVTQSIDEHPYGNAKFVEPEDAREALGRDTSAERPVDPFGVLRHDRAGKPTC